MLIASMLIAKQFMVGSAEARSMGAWQRSVLSASVSSVTLTPQQEAALKSHHEHTIEEAFGWIKTIAGLRKAKLRGLVKAGWAFTFAAAAYNLIRLPKLIAAKAN